MQVFLPLVQRSGMSAMARNPSPHQQAAGEISSCPSVSYLRLCSLHLHKDRAPAERAGVRGPKGAPCPRQ